MTLESVITSSALKWLNQQPQTKAIKIHGNAFTERGTPDIMGTCNGRTFFIEMKQPGKEPEPIQVARMQQWEAAGAWVTCAHSLAEVQSFYGSVTDHHRQH